MSLEEFNVRKSQIPHLHSEDNNACGAQAHRVGGGTTVLLSALLKFPVKEVKLGFFHLLCL